MVGFEIGSKGFHLHFANGLVLSTQFGEGNYCNNWNIKTYPNLPAPCKDCEIRVYISDGEDTIDLTEQIPKSVCATPRGEDLDVIGYVNFEDWLRVVNWCKNYKPEQEAAID